MFKMLEGFNIVGDRVVPVTRKFLLDETFGRQNGDAVIEFNSRSLDLIFKDYVRSYPSLF